MKKPLFFTYVLFIALALFWSLSFLSIRISINFFHPIFGTLLRIAIAFLTLSLWFFITKTPLKLPLKISRLLWFQGIIGQALPFLFLFWGEQYITPGLASILNAVVPLWVLMINGFILREKGTFTLKKTTGLFLGFLGIVTIFAPMISDNPDVSDHLIIMGVLALFAMGISYAAGAIFYQKILAKTQVAFKASVWHQHIGSLAFTFIIALLMNTWPHIDSMSDIPLEAILALLYLGIFSTALAFLMYSYLIAEWGAVRAVSVLYIVPVFSVIWDVLFLHLPFHLYELFGMIMILLGVLFVQRPKPDKSC
jgi:drug/metabolite transporter (DMT)-like permease